MIKDASQSNKRPAAGTNAINGNKDANRSPTSASAHAFSSPVQRTPAARNHANRPPPLSASLMRSYSKRYVEFEYSVHDFLSTDKIFNV